MNTLVIRFIEIITGRRNKPAFVPVRVRVWKSVIFLIPAILFAALSFGQAVYTGTTVDLVISGTSTLHDWNMKSGKANCTAVFDFNNAGQITGLRNLSFSTPSNSLKSEHTAMDNNAYKALKSDKSPVITYTMSSVSVVPAAGGASTVTCSGKLTMAGATLNEDIIAVCKPNADNTITVTGTRKISMKDFNIDPPSFMFGTVKTGNDVVLKFNLILKKS